MGYFREGAYNCNLYFRAPLKTLPKGTTEKAILGVAAFRLSYG